MNRELTLTPVLINHQPHPSPKSWVKLLIYEPTEAKVVATRGKMHAVLSLSSQADIDFTPIMQLIIETLQQRYFGVTEGGILQTLEVALDAIHKQLLLAGQQDKRLSAGFSFDILVAVSWGTVLYLGQLGSSRACLLRQQKLFNLDQDQTKNSSTYLSSGVVQAGDRFLLATDELLAKFTQKQLLHHLSLPTTTLVQSLEQQIDHQPNSLESGILLLVDIKQVPSVEDESIRIRDTDTVAALPVRPSFARRINAASRTFGSWLSRLWHWHLGGRLPGLPLLIICLCLLIIIGSVAYRYLQPAQHASIDVSHTVTQLQGQLNQANQVSTINPDRAQDLLNQMEPTLSQALAASSDSRLKTIANQRQQLQNTLLNVQILTPHPLATVSNQLEQSKMTILGADLYFINNQHQLLRLQQQTISPIAANTQLFTSATYLAATANGLVALQPQRATLLSNAGQAVHSVTIPVEQVIASTGYQPNAYALGANGQLSRIATQTNTLSSPANYFSTNISPAGLRDVAIDGDVYILRQDGSIEKYSSGQKQSFTLDRSTLSQDARALFTDENTDNLYLLSDHSLLVWSKNGQYIGQYQLSTNSHWQAAAVDALHKTLYILSEGKLVEAQLSQ